MRSKAALGKLQCRIDGKERLGEGLDALYELGRSPTRRNPVKIGIPSTNCESQSVTIWGRRRKVTVRSLTVGPTWPRHQRAEGNVRS